MEREGLFYQYIDDFLEKGEKLLPEGVGIDFGCVPDVGDVIPLHFERDGEETKSHHYYVLGRVFRTPAFTAYRPDGKSVMEVVIFVHSEDDATNKDWETNRR